MKFSADCFYHVYNRGNNREPIFFQERNYEFFALKLKTIIGDHCNIVAYCLMPNHFHLLLHLDDNSSGLSIGTKPELQVLEQKLGTLQSSYTRAINNQENRKGSLFQTKIKVVQTDLKHATTAFHYIHQNPLKAKLTGNFLEWNHSSFKEYLHNYEGICRKDVAYNFLDIPTDSVLFEKLSREVIVDEGILLNLK